MPTNPQGNVGGENGECFHPSDRIVYYSEIDDEGREYEEYWCADCRVWLTPGFMESLYDRPDWDGGITEYDLIKQGYYANK
jgi:hypothetical protein